MTEEMIKELNLQERLIERFFRYAAIETQSKEGVEEVPSTPGQWDLAKLLAEDLKELGLEDISISDHCVVIGHLPARLQKERKNVPTIGWIAHMDTVDVALSPEVHPQLIRNYQGGDVCQNAEKNIYISVEEHPELLEHIGEDLIVSDGTSVLGADNKAAIVNIICALEVLQNHPEIEHGEIYVAFVPDEEVGLCGARKMDLSKFPVDYAYTIDCCTLGEVVYETFNAGAATLRVKGVTAHPMSSKNNLVNPLLVAVDFINLLNRGQAPEFTEGREGYIWPTDINSDVLNCVVQLNIRDHDKAGYEAKKAYLEEGLKLIRMKHPKAEIELDLRDVYGNIADAVTDENRQCIDDLYTALEELGIPAKTIPMRGGTDGSYISTQGILTPNYFTGAHNFHSRCEFMPMGAVEKSCLVTLKLMELAVRNK
ncbi:MAG: peptidase T [Eubacteriales bacterium]|nr:peptidase T [Eubacteriales bacterium]